MILAAERHPESARLARAAMRASGCRNMRQFGRLISPDVEFSDSAVRKWVNGQAAPGYAATLRMLRIVNALDEKAWHAAQLLGENEPNLNAERRTRK